jgi:hypothetical protein
VRKLWFARILCVLAAVALVSVVIEERQAQVADREPLRTICWSQPEAQGNAAGPRSGLRVCTDAGRRELR